MKKHNILQVIFLSELTLVGCEKNMDVQPGIRLKTLEVLNDSSGEVYHKYNFYYDSISGNLLKMIRDGVDSVIVLKINSSTVKLSFFYNSSGDFMDAYVNLDDNQFVYSVNRYSIDDPATRYYSFILKNGGIADSIIEPEMLYPTGFGAYRESFIDYNIQMSNSNYTSNDVFYKRIYLNGITPPDSGTTHYLYSYTGYENNGLVPLQRIYGIEIFSGWYLDEIDPIYLLNICGYNAYKPNKYLIDRIQNDKGREIVFAYTFDAHGNATELHDVTGRKIYKMTYYY